jgi:uncharacterized protein YjbI with pentapeptide repeats
LGESCEGFQDALEEAVRKQQWLEGVIISSALNSAILSWAKMPRAVFEGIELRNVCLDHSDLREANFRSTTMQAVLLNGCNLSRAIFDMAECIRPTNSGFSIDLSNSDLGGASFTNTKLGTAKLFGLRLSAPTLTSVFMNAHSALWAD